MLAMQAKRAFNKYKPDIVLYIDRLDVTRRDTADLPVMRAITGEQAGAAL